MTKRHSHHTLLPTLSFLLLLSATAWSEKINNQAVQILREHAHTSPRDVFRTFWEAMNERREKITRGEDAAAALARAVACLDTSQLPTIARAEEAQQAAIRLKEIIDRVAVPDFSAMPDEQQSADLQNWNWLGTRIQISRVMLPESQLTAFLFSAGTVRSASEMFDQVRHLPYVAGGGLGAGGTQFRTNWQWANEDFLGMAVWQWAGLFFIILIGLSIRLVIHLCMGVIYAAAKKSRWQWDHMFVKALEWPLSLIIASAFWYVSINALQLTGLPLSITATVIKITFYTSIVWAGYALTGALGQIATNRARNNGNTDHHLVKLLSQSARIFVLIMGSLFAAQGLGFNVVSLVAGLGIGGLAVAMAAKDTLANFFGSIAIMLDRPFKVGHWIKIGNNEGIVEEIGFRSTRIRTFYDSLISVPNSEIVTGQVDNMGVRNYRRTTTTIGITYDTPAEKIEAFIEGIKNIILANPATRKDNFHVVLNNFGPSSLDILLYFYISAPNWGIELVERQRVLMEIVRLARSLGVQFAFPTQTLHIETTPEHPEPNRTGPSAREELERIAREFGQQGALSQPRGLGIFTPPFEQKNHK